MTSLFPFVRSPRFLFGGSTTGGVTTGTTHVRTGSRGGGLQEKMTGLSERFDDKPFHDGTSHQVSNYKLSSD